MLSIPHTSAEPIYAPTRTGFPGDEDVDPSTFPVYTLLTADTNLIPTAGDPGWVAASWTVSGGFHYATHPYAGDLPAGLYFLWVKIVVGTGNLPIRQSGPVTLT